MGIWGSTNASTSQILHLLLTVHCGRGVRVCKGHNTKFIAVKQCFINIAAETGPENSTIVHVNMKEIFFHDVPPPQTKNYRQLTTSSRRISQKQIHLLVSWCTVVNPETIFTYRIKKTHQHMYLYANIYLLAIYNRSFVKAHIDICIKV